MPFDSVSDPEIIGQLCYIIVEPAGTPLIEEALSFPVSVSKLGSRAGSLSSAALSTLPDFLKSARIGSEIAIFIFPHAGREKSTLLYHGLHLHDHMAVMAK